MECGKCGSAIVSGSKFCAECGSEVNPSENRNAFGIKCFVPECTNSVIGQCPGLPDEPCGHFYCSEHSKGKLCDECDIVNETRILYNEYCQAAEQILNYRPTLLIVFGVLVMITSAILALFSSPLWFIVFGLTLVIIIVFTVAKKNSMYAEACERYEGFEEFYKEYRRAFNRNQLGQAISLTTDLVLGGIGETASERDLRHIRSRIERMP